MVGREPWKPRLILRLVAVALAVIGTQRQCFLDGRLALLPEPLRRLGMQAVAARVEDKPDDFPILQVVVEGFAPGHVLLDGLRHSAGAGAGSDRDSGGQQPPHALLAEATQEGPHRVGGRVRVLSALGGGAFGTQYERAAQFVAPLDLVHTLELALRKIPRWFHACSLLLAPLGPPSGGMMVGVRPSQWTATCSLQEGQGARVPTAGVRGLPWQERGPIVAAHEEASHGYTASVPTAQAYLAVVSRGSSANQRVYSESSCRAGESPPAG
jgi:hypothetical protein